MDTEFYGECQLCSCFYIGSGNHTCSCGHATVNHVKLAACSLEGCSCKKFLSAGRIPECYDCLHSSESHNESVKGDIIVETLRGWVLEGQKIDNVVELYKKKVQCSHYGPNYLWSVDGHEKLAQPFGLYIYGVLDTFSRKVLALHVIPNKKSLTVSNWLLGEICLLGGKPSRIMIDRGTEWGEVTQAVNVVQMDSVFNQKIEAFWGQMLRLSDVSWYRAMLQSLERDGHFTRQDEIDRWIVWKLFSALVQSSLNQYRETHNMNVIRKQKNLNLPRGYSPNYMHVENYLERVPRTDISRLTSSIDKKFQLPEQFHEQPTKMNCKQLYIDIRQYVKE